MDDCQLVSCRARTSKLWFFANGDDLFIEQAEVIDIWESPSQTTRAA
jgi:hypothetical protein